MTTNTPRNAQGRQWMFPRIENQWKTPRSSNRVPVIEVGGTNAKVLATGKRTPRKVSSPLKRRNR